MDKMSDRGFVSGFIGVGIHMTIQHILQLIHIAKRCKKELADMKELVMSIELTIMHIQQNRMAFKSNEEIEKDSDVNRWLNELDALLLDVSKMVQRCSIPKSHANFSGRQSKTKTICSLNANIREHLKLSPLLVRIPEDQMEDTQKDKVKVSDTQKVLEGLGKTKDSLEPLASSATTSQAAMNNLVVGQNQAFQSLQRLVIENVEAKNIGVLGKSGSGKTLHLRTLFNSQEVRDHFKGGLLLWLTVPQRPSITDLCQQIATQKGIDLKNENKEVDEKEWVSHQLEKSNRLALFLDDVCEGNGTELLDGLGIGQIAREHPNSKVIVSSRDRTALSNMEVLDNYTVTIEDFWNFRGKNNLIEETDMVELDNTFANLERFVIDDHVEARKIGVVGRYGSAKSLLKTLFNRQKVRTHFRNGLLLWLSLSQSPPVTSPVNDLCQQIAKQQNENLGLITAMDEEEKKRWLNDQLQQSSRFALFLDDVRGSDAGRLFEELGIVGAAIDPINTKVIVSSTDLTALSEVGVAENYTITIQDLNQADSWNLLKDHAKFPYNIGNLPSNIEIPLENPVCAGLPQAIKVVGRAMASSTHPQQWEWALDRLQNAQSLDDCLRLSFDALGNDDVNMQLCFLHIAAAFPKDAIIEAQEVIPLWMGEGLLARKKVEHVPRHVLTDHCLIEPMIRNTEGRPVCLRMQDPFQIGKLYLDLLAERCLIQPTARDADGLVLCFRMLNIVRDWAILIAKDEENFYCCVGNGNGLKHLQNNNESSKIKRLFLSGKDLRSLQQFSSYKEMRSLLISENTGLTKIPKKVIGSMLSLKILDLSGTSARSLPNVACLKELICLKLSGTRIKELPKSVTGLGHLEILDVSFTDIKELPSDIHKLRSLRYLGLRGCTDLQYLPSSISSLLSLQYLYMDGCSSMLTKPSGNRRKNVMDGCRKVAPLQSLGDLIQLKQLALQTNGEQQLQHLPDGNRQQLEQLVGKQLEQLLKSMTEMDTLLLVLPEMVSLPLHISDMSKLRSLSLKCSKLIKMNPFICFNLTDTQFNFKMKNDVTHLKHLSYLKFYECDVLKEFQHLHKLPYLRQLEIFLCGEVENFPIEFGQKEAFPSLKTFSLVGLQKLEGLPEIKAGAMPSLEIFTVMDCPEFRMPDSYLNLGTRRTKIRVRGCPIVMGERMEMFPEAAKSIKAKEVIERYLEEHQKKEKWLYGECWCIELFQSIKDMGP